MIEAIYDAATDEEAFAALPGRLAQAVGARSATFQIIEAGAPVHVGASYFSPEMSAYYVDQGIGEHDVWNTMVQGRALTGRALTSDRLLTRQQFADSVFFNDFFRVFGDDTGVSLGAVITTGQGFIGLGLHRAITVAGYEDTEVARLDEAVPHLRRMVEIRRRLALQQSLSADLGSAIDAHAHGVILIDGIGRVVFANRAAQSILMVGDALKTREGRLVAIDPACQSRLDRAIVEAASDTGSRGGALWARRAEGSACRLMVSPNRTPAGSAGVIIVIDDLAAAPVDSRASLRALYGLTAAEADLAQRLYEGLSTQEAAEARNVSLTTTQAQLKSIRARTGTRRQAELMTLIAGLGRLAPRDA